MQIQGKDIVLETTLTNEEIFSIIGYYWPDLIIEEIAPNEFAIYRDKPTECKWNVEGWSKEIDPGLITFIRNGISSELTFVIDNECTLLPLIRELEFVRYEVQ